MNVLLQKLFRLSSKVDVIDEIKQEHAVQVEVFNAAVGEMKKVLKHKNITLDISHATGKKYGR